MTSPSQLMQAISEATGVPLATVTDIDRWLLRESLRSKSGRGRSAARITPLDAARLLTAVLASPQSNAAAEAVLRYERTRPDKRRSSEGLFGTMGSHALAALPAKHSFVEGLAALVTSISNGSLAMSGKQGLHIEVFAFTGATHGRIRVSGLPSGATAMVEYIPAATGIETPRSRAGKKSANQCNDLEQSRRITERTIFAVGKLLAGERNDAR